MNQSDKKLNSNSRSLSSNLDEKGEVKTVLQDSGLGLEDLARHIKNVILSHDQTRNKMEQHGIDEDWIISELKKVAEEAIDVDKDGVASIDYKTRLKAVKEISVMGKYTGSADGVSSIVKALLNAQGAKSGNEINFNFTKMLYGG